MWTTRHARGYPRAGLSTARGLPTQRNVLFDAGRFTDFLLDTYSARKLGKTSTHNAGRGGALTTVTTSNFYLEPGTHTPDEIIASVDQGLFLTDLIGLPRTSPRAISRAARAASGLRMGG